MAFVKQIKEDYWDDFTINENDINFIYNHLLEIETPQTTLEITNAIISNRILFEKDAIYSKTQDSGTVYMPMNTYKEGDSLIFSSLDWAKGIVQKVRDGFNPEFDELKVIQVAFDDHSTKEYAINIKEHILNTPIDLIGDNQIFDQEFVFKNYKEKIFTEVETTLKNNSELVRIAGSWFPRALLVDINVGILNLVEAVLEEAKGGPMDTRELMKHVDMQSDANQKLLEFSFNLALQEDDRFDEVGPSGEVLWYLKSAEPEYVKNPPPFLEYKMMRVDREIVQELIAQFEGNVFDELEVNDIDNLNSEHITISLIYPHWRSGTLPLSSTLIHLFPTAYEAPRVRFTFVDEKDKKIFNGWVVRPHQYVYGLKNWYEEKGLIPGSFVTISKSDKPGNIIISSQRSRQNKEWLKTVLVGADQGIVFALLKQTITADYNERMAIAIPDVELLDDIWLKDHGKQKFESIIRKCIHELAKLNPQGHIHAQELYATVNILFRCPPGPILEYLLKDKNIKHLGDLYFHFQDENT